MRALDDLLNRVALHGRVPDHVYGEADAIVKAEIAKGRRDATVLLAIYDHAHSTGNSVPSHAVREAKKMIADANVKVAVDVEGLAR